MTEPDRGYYPIHLYRPGFKSLGHKFPADDAAVLRWLAGLAAQRPSPHFAEIGSFVGISALILSEFAPVDCFDIWRDTGTDDRINQAYREHDVFSVFRHNIYGLPTKNPVRHTKLGSHFSGATRHYTLMFIDGSHEEADVARDIQNCTENITPYGGILCGHDYGIFDGVTKAVNEISPDGVSGSMWWMFL